MPSGKEEPSSWGAWRLSAGKSADAARLTPPTRPRIVPMRTMTAKPAYRRIGEPAGLRASERIAAREGVPAGPTGPARPPKQARGKLLRGIKARSRFPWAIVASRGDHGAGCRHSTTRAVHAPSMGLRSPHAVSGLGPMRCVVERQPGPHSPPPAASRGLPPRLPCASPPRHPEPSQGQHSGRWTDATERSVEPH